MFTSSNEFKCVFNRLKCILKILRNVATLHNYLITLDQLNQLGSKAASESAVKRLNTCGVSNNKLNFTICVQFTVGLVELSTACTMKPHEL